MNLSTSTTIRPAKVYARELKTHMVRLLRRAWHKVCPWERAQVPQLDPAEYRLSRPPATPRHRSGRRDTSNNEEENVEAVVPKAGSLVLTMPGLYGSAKKR